MSAFSSQSRPPSGRTSKTFFFLLISRFFVLLIRSRFYLGGWSVKFTVERSRIDPIERRSSDQRNESGEQQNEKETKGKRKDCFFCFVFACSSVRQQRKRSVATKKLGPFNSAEEPTKRKKKLGKTRYNLIHKTIFTTDR